MGTSSLSAMALSLVAGATLIKAISIPDSISHSNILAGREDVKDEYDYIIVGGGTSGLTVADRLTEDGNFTVLVIELGTFDNSTSVQTVYLGDSGLFNQSHMFSFNSAPQVNLRNRTTSVMGGVMLGGSSGVNGMQVHRGQKDDYNAWGQYFSNNSEWSWDGMLPYFKKAWNFHPPNPDQVVTLGIQYDTSYWGNTSNIHCSFPTFNWPMLKTELAAFGEIEGVQFPPDSGAGIPGAFWYPASTDPSTMTRSLSRTGHWDGIQRDNYETITGQKVLKVLFDGNRTSGVSYVAAKAKDDADAQSVKARKEVIMAAGSIHTPQILQGSGIGPKALLEAANITVQVDLPGVGHNFQDHPFNAGASYTISNVSSYQLNPTDMYDATFSAEARAEFAANKTGPLTITSGNAAGFLPLSLIAPDAFDDIASRLEAQDPAAYLPADSDPTVIAGYKAQKATLAGMMRSNSSAILNLFLRQGGMAFEFIDLHPTSRGTVTIDPADPYFHEPIVDYRALSNPTDVDVIVEFINFARRFFNQTSISQFAPQEVTPGAAVTTTEALRASLAEIVSPTTYHPLGTSAMMPLELGGVVDEKLQVYGVDGLTVVDASIIPQMPGAYTQQTVYAVAEKAADLIKARA